MNHKLVESNSGKSYCSLELIDTLFRQFAKKLNLTTDSSQNRLAICIKKFAR